MSISTGVSSFVVATKVEVIGASFTGVMVIEAVATLLSVTPVLTLYVKESEPL